MFSVVSRNDTLRLSGRGDVDWFDRGGGRYRLGLPDWPCAADVVSLCHIHNGDETLGAKISSELTAVGVQSHAGEVVAQNLGVGIVAVVVVTPAAATLAAAAIGLLRAVLGASRGLRLVLFGIVLAIDALLQVREPRVNLGLRLHKALA